MLGFLLWVLTSTKLPQKAMKIGFAAPRKSAVFSIADFLLAFHERHSTAKFYFA